MLNQQEQVEAETIQATLRAKLEAAAAAADITPRGRDRLRARAVIEAQTAIRELRARSDARVQAAFDKAYREAFGLSLERSAEDRALRAELAANPPGAVEAQQRLAAALAIGDHLQARALAQLAFEHRNDELGADAWMVVAEQYGASAPTADRLMAAVFDAGTEPSKMDKFRDKAATDILVPADLQRGNLAAIAADDDGQPSGTAAGARFGA
jgi:hypothetical protein